MEVFLELVNLILRKWKSKKKRSNGFELDNVYLDKSWEIIAYILVGKLGPRDNLILSEVIHPRGNYITYEDKFFTEYVNYSTPNRVQEIHDELEKIDEQKFKQLFEERDFSKFEIYPQGIWTKSEKDYQYLSKFFFEIKKIFKRAVENENYIVVNIG